MPSGRSEAAFPNGQQDKVRLIALGNRKHHANRPALSSFRFSFVALPRPEIRVTDYGTVGRDVSH